MRTYILIYPKALLSLVILPGLQNEKGEIKVKLSEKITSQSSVTLELLRKSSQMTYLHAPLRMSMYP